MHDAQAEKGSAFRALHQGKTFPIPNPWDVGTARMFGALGFKALATTSAGFAFTFGRRDGSVTLDELCDHVAALAKASPLPISVDIENGFGGGPEDAARAVEAVAAAGAVGGSIEDYGADAGIYDVADAAERIAAAAAAAGALDFTFTLTARVENHIRGNPDLDDTIARLTAYERAGADVLYAPGLRTLKEIRAVCEAVSKPVNVLGFPDMDWNEIAAAGAKRVSVGSQLTWVAMSAAATAAEAFRDGDLAALASQPQVKQWLA